MTRRLAGLSIICASALLGCASNPTANLERIERKVADVPEERVSLQITESGVTIDGQSVSFPKVQRRLGNLRGRTVYCEIDKFASISEQQLEEFASAVTRSGGRFFFRQNAGAIHSLFYCTELREEPRGGGGLGGRTKKAEQDVEPDA